ncbi:MAG: phytanoyl-CoA dioxygenase family protein [Crocinitomicaceae bacterium]|nr:phytanoyl-CoA dioxygenase family protein [Crocinitomicaceae bacterium]NGF76781.1 phytanoyl-CoA dioxygenase family protein [Fluviicola sp. SGL-29]
MKQPVFSDKRNQLFFEQHGYVIVDSPLGNDAIDQIINGYQQLTDNTQTPFESTMNNPNPDYKENVHRLLYPFMNQLCSDYLQEYTPLIGNFVVKYPHDNSAVPPHQDWNMVDEAEYTGVNIWLALDNVTEQNGALYIVAGSHLMSPTLRGSNINSAFNGNLLNDYRTLTPVFLKKGQALIYDLKCIHMSPPNKSSSVRMAAGCACIPVKAQPLHYFQNEQGLTLYNAPTEFYYHFYYGSNKISEQTNVIKVIQMPENNISDDQIHQLITNQNPFMKSIFKDAQHQNKYDVDGFFITDALDKESLSDLLRFFQKETPWFQEGFLSSVYAPIDGYKEKIDLYIESLANKLTKTLFNDYEVVINTFMVKGKGGNSEMYPHQDWTLVDETKYASFNIWIPLVDVDFDNGAIHIMKGGHKLPFTYRGSCIPDALQNHAAFHVGRLTYLPMKAGQALVYDHRCIHASPVNKSKSVRPAIVISVVPKQAEVFHLFYEKDENRLLKYTANKDFYFKHVHNQFNKPTFTLPYDTLENVTEFAIFSESDLQKIWEIQQPLRRNLVHKILSLLKLS